MKKLSQIGTYIIRGGKRRYHRGISKEKSSSSEYYSIPVMSRHGKIYANYK